MKFSKQLKNLHLFFIRMPLTNLRRYQDLSIKKKLLLILYIQIIIPIVLIGYISYMKSAQIIETKSINYSLDILKMTELRMGDFEKNISLISQDLLYDNDVYNVLKNPSVINDPIKDYENEGKIKNVMKKILLSREEVQAIGVVTFDNKVYLSDNATSKSNYINNLPSFKNLKEIARKYNGKTTWYLDSKDKNVNNVLLVRTVYNRDQFKEIGLIFILVKKDYLKTIFMDISTEIINDIVLLSDKKELIIHRNEGDEAPFWEKTNFEDLNGKKGYLLDKNNNQLIAYTKMDQTNWVILSHVNLDVLYADINILRRITAILSIISVVIISLLSIYLTMDLLKPIKRILKAMGKLETGDSTAYLEVNRKDELGYLETAFNKMAKEINKLVNGIYREQITRKEAEIRALQSQINPHFLFNTLEAINWMAQLNNVPEISDMVTELGTLMEASIGRGDKLITLSEELSYTDKYLSLLNRRFDNKIEYKKHLETNISEFKIPRLLLQPLIENAAFHGLASNTGNGVIELNASVKNDIINIEVMDNGVGIQKESLDILNERLSMSNDSYFKTLGTRKNKSIGIENVNRRIKLFYGENYGLTIESQQNRFTKVLLTIPLNSIINEVYYVQGSNH